MVEKRPGGTDDTLPDRLKAATSGIHATVEAEVGLMAPDLRRAEYVAILQRLADFHASLEPVVAAALGDAGFMEPRRRLPALLADLVALDAAGSRTAVTVPDIAETPAALGALYVTEGARLGGRVIARHLTRVLGFEDGRGISYFAGRPGEVGPLWAALRIRLAGIRSARDEQVVIDTALATFATFRTAVCRPEQGAARWRPSLVPT